MEVGIDNKYSTNNKFAIKNLNKYFKLNQYFNNLDLFIVYKQI